MDISHDFLDELDRTLENYFVIQPEPIDLFCYETLDDLVFNPLPEEQEVASTS